MRQAMHAFFKQNSGSSIVIVIVAIAFVGILGATILWMSFNNYMMKATDAKHKASFYSAETVFEQIIAGLQEEASLATDTAYSNVMQRYSTLDESNRNHEFQVEYLNALKNAISSASPGHYDLNILKSYVNPELLDTLGGTRVRELDGGSCELLAPTNAAYVILKDLELQFENDNGFLTIISTDIMISIPENDFTQSAPMPDIFDFCLIANESLENTINGPVTINGSIYGGENGIHVYHRMKIKNADKIVTDADISLMNANAVFDIGHGDEDTGHADDTDIPSVWAENIAVGGGTVDLYSKTYVADDITISGNSAALNLRQEYYGYGNSITDASKSSAITINGINNSIDLSGLDKMLLAGHSYIGTSNAVSADTIPLIDTTYVSNQNDNRDILMGESIAIKGDQIAYLVPDECIGILNGDVVIGRNPMSGAEYTQLLALKASNPGSFDEVSFVKPLSMLGGTTSLSAYSTEFKTIFCPSNGETLVYYYLVMNEKNANQYFRDYYGHYKDKLDRYFNIYAKGGIHTDSFTRINIQGNWMTSVTTGATESVSLNEAISGNAISLSGESAQYADIFSALKTKLITNYFKITEAERNNSVFRNIIKHDETVDFIANNGGNPTFAVSSNGINAVFTNAATYHYSNLTDPVSKTRLIVSTGDVILEKDFTGLVIANGTITVEHDVTVNSILNANEKENMAQLLQCAYGSGLTPDIRPIDLFVNGSSYVLDGTSVATDDSDVIHNIDLTKLVRYENWIKK